MTGNSHPITNTEFSRWDIRANLGNCTTSFMGWDLRELCSRKISSCRYVIGMTVGCCSDFDEDVTSIWSWNGDLVNFVWFVKLGVS
jgi:hypothetical protein